jgi:CheY-like chemotaxis protein
MPAHMPKVLALIDDLFFRARIAEAARHVGVEFEVAATPDALLAAAQASTSERPALILIDLNAGSAPSFGGIAPAGAGPQTAAASQKGIETLERLRSAGNQTPVVAFLSHVQLDLAERARAAGGAEIMPRSKFSQNLAEILSRAKSQPTQAS